MPEPTQNAQLLSTDTTPLINKTVLMSSADRFNDTLAINPLMDASVPVDVPRAVAEHQHIAEALHSAGVTVHSIPAPEGSQDGVYTANWALVRDGKALMARLPNTRKTEEAPAKAALEHAGIETFVLPEHVARFSGQGDALPCGELVFTQSPYRTTTDAHPFLTSILGFKEVIALQTLPAYDENGAPVTNAITGLPDSPTYDIDLALAVLKPPFEGQKGLIAYAPEVFTAESQNLLAAFDKVDKIQVSKTEALHAFALNLLSTGRTVIMNSGAPQFQAELEAHGLQTITLDLPELKKGGGSIRCTTLTLDN